MITPEQIEANKADTRRRREQRRKAQEQNRVGAQPVQHDERFPDYNGKLVGFVVKTRHDKFKPLIGRPHNSPGDNDSIVWVVGEKPPQETLAAAIALLETMREHLVLLLQKPVPTHGMMGHWLSPMLACQGTE